ncbi:hypothetical protein ACX6XY_29045 [Streptomyces sp. O3]
MSLGDERGRPEGDGYGGTGQTRTRLPEGRDVYGGARRPARSSRSLVTVVGVVVLLIAAIAFANRGDGGGGGDSGSGGSPGAAPTAASGKAPATGQQNGIPTGYARDREGAQSAAANYAAALGSDGMFNESRRHAIVDTVADPSARSKLRAGFDADYSQEFLKKVGLKKDGSAPAGNTFVSRTMPIGTKATAYSDSKATIEVWSSGLFGLTGEGSTNPVTNSWFTVTVQLKWTGDDWKVLETSQKTGPTPVNGDNPASRSDEIAEAVENFGGFTYAR